MKCLDETGRPAWLYQTTAAPNREELLGALVVHTDLLRKELVSEWDDEEEGGGCRLTVRMRVDGVTRVGLTLRLTDASLSW
ncbi:MAG: hypothetical protein JWP40_4190 [Blastococcus sp.]|nr:hypothetical protein [Blastococcus sp.]